MRANAHGLLFKPFIPTSWRWAWQPVPGRAADGYDAQTLRRPSWTAHAHDAPSLGQLGMMSIISPPGQRFLGRGWPAKAKNADHEHHQPHPGQQVASHAHQ